MSRHDRIWRARSALLFLPLMLACACTAQESLGKTLYEKGEGSDGPLVHAGGPDWLRHARGGCVTCHGRNGEGLTARAGTVTGTAPPVAYRTLVEKGYTDEKIRRAIREGVGHDGVPLHGYMPRWEMTDKELDALLDHLKGLSGD